MKKTLLAFFLFVLILHPVSTYAQTYNPDAAFNDNNGGDLVGATIASFGTAGLTCLLADQKVVGAIRNFTSGIVNNSDGSSSAIGRLFAKLTSSGVGTSSQEQPVKDAEARAQLKKEITKEACWDQFANKAGQFALKQLTTKTLTWVNTGFDGNPLYVRDIDAYLKSVRDQQIKKFLPETAANDPIFGNALRSIIRKQVTGQSDGLLNKAKTTPEAIAYQNFTKDFTQGGWSALLNTSNNPLSSLFRETNSLNGLITNRSNNIQQELIRNNGFLDIRTCIEYAKEGGVGSANGSGLSTQPECLRYGTVTPGSVISQQVGDILGSPVRQAEMVDEINEVVGKFFGEIGNKLFSKSGLFGLSSGSGAGLGGTGFGLNALTDENGALIGSENFFDSPTSGVGISGDTDVSRPQIVRFHLQNQKDYYNASNDAVTAATAILPQLGELDYCMPGPNPTWKVGLNENIGSLIDTAIYSPTKKLDTIIIPFSVIDKVTQNTINVSTKSGQFERLEFTKGQFEGAVQGAGVGASIGSAFSPLGAAIGAGLGFIGGLFTSGETTTIDGRALRINNGPDAGVFKDYFITVAQRLITEIDTTYNVNTIATAFESAGGSGADKTVNREQAIAAYTATASLIEYSDTVNELGAEYVQTNAQVSSNIAELESIHTEVLALVKVAKARYIAERAAAGNPVNMQCIDSAYVINETPVLGQPRKETGSSEASINSLIQANEYFYNSI